MTSEASVRESGVAAAADIVAFGSRRRAWMVAVGWLVFHAALCLALFHQTVETMAATWMNTTAYNHGILIAPVSLWLVWGRRHELARLTPSPEPWALPVLALGSLGWLLGWTAEANVVMQLSFVGMLVALTVAVLGRAVGRCLAFPLLFLFAMVPFGDFLVPWLQDFTARFSVALLRVFGIPVFHDGVFIELPNGSFHVAEACAGLRFMIANVVVALLFAHLSFRHWWKAAAFVALGVAVPLIANGLRAFGIIMLAHLTDNQAAVDADHIVYGWGFFVFVMFVLLAIGNRFADLPARRPLRVAEPGGERPPRRGWLVAVPMLAVAVGPAYALALTQRPVAPVAAILPPPAVAGWAEATPPADWRPSFSTADATLLRSFRAGGRTVEVFVAYYTHERPGANLIHFENRFDDADTWIRLETGSHSVPGAAVPARFVRLGETGRQRAVVYWYWVDGKVVSSAAMAKLLRLDATLGGGMRGAAVLALSAEARDPAAAVAAIDSFAGGLPPLEQYFESLGKAQ